MTAEVIYLAARLPGRRAEAKAKAPDELVGRESVRQYVARTFARVTEKMGADELEEAHRLTMSAARELRWLIARGLLTEAQERQAAIKTKRRIDAAERGAETRARNKAARSREHDGRGGA